MGEHVRETVSPRESTWLAGRRAQRLDVLVGVLALAAAFGAIEVITSGGVVLDPVGYSVVLAGNIIAAALAGLLWLRGRPWSPFGRVLLGLAALDTVAALVGSPSPWLFIGAVLVQWIAALGSTWVMVAFPSGKLDGGGRAVMAIAAGTFVFLALPQMLVTESVTGIAAVGRCAGDCPPNALLVASHGSLSHALGTAAGAGRTAWAVGIVVLLTAHFIAASRPRRRMIAPVYATALPFAIVFGLNALFVDTLRSHALATPWIHISFVVTRMVFPLGYIGAILLAQAYAGVALTDMARVLRSAPPLSEAEALVRRVLDDDTARVGFWLPRLRRFVDRHGELLELESAAEGRSWRSFSRSGDTTIALEHDPALADYPELVDAVGSALLIAVENRQLEQDLLGSIHALRASQRRLALAAAAERRRIERDLHDSTQQRLVAVRIQLDLVCEQLPPQSAVRGRLAELGREVEEALEELRAVAHGIYPQLLYDEGLDVALREAARRVPVPVALRLEDVGRLPEELETAIYYCCLEALQNVAKHAGDGASAVVELCREHRQIRFTVSDDGFGFAGDLVGAGVTNMHDRVAAVGGTLRIRSTPGGGTVVDGRVVAPLAAAASAGCW